VTLPQTLEEAELRTLIEALAPHLVCWKTGLYYGSMVYFQLGDKVEVEVRGEPKLVGSANVSLDCDDWKIRARGTEIASSPTITRERAEEDLSRHFVGQRLVDVRASDRDLELLIAFTGDLEIILRPSQDPEAGDNELAAIRLSNGYIVACNLDRGDKRLVFRTERYDRFAQQWRKDHLS
jgi:hypothetical protein